jgi:hypothetical protein
MILTLLQPEYMLGVAVEQWYAVRTSMQWFKDMGHEEWSWTHGFFASMNGFQVQCPDGTKYALRVEELNWLEKREIIRIPVLPKEEILDRNKTDALAKLIACLQSGWLMVQAIARIAEGLDISALEIMTIAFVLSTFVTYGFWWMKPSDIELGNTVLATKEKNDWWPEMCKDLPVTQWRIEEVEKHVYGVGDMHFNAHSFLHNVIFNIGASLFGAFHLLAWDIAFPSPIERLLWRISSVFCVAWPLFQVATRDPIIDALKRKRIIPRRYEYSFFKTDGKSPSYIQYALLVVFIFCRLYLIVESFVSLRLLPSSVYDTVQWPGWFAHL